MNTFNSIWKKFKMNKRSIYSLYIFSTLFILSLFSELISNNKPIIMNIDGNIYYPYIINYTEKDFGGELETTPDYKGFYITSLLKENKNWALFPLNPHSYNSINFNNDFDIYTKYKELNIIDYLKTINIINEKYITLYNINNGDNQEKRMLNNIKYDNINDIIDNTNIENIKSNDKLISIQGDCIEMLDNLKQKTIQTIIIDPPYNIGKDTWDNIDNYNEWLTDIIKKLEYKLRDNGSMFIFHNNMEAISELMVSIKKNTKLKFVQMITWNKRYEGSKRKGFLDGYVSKNSAHKWELMAEYILFYIFDNTWKYKEARINKKVCAKDIQKEIPSKTGGMTGWYGNIETGLNHPTRERMIPITKHLGLEYDDVVPKFINQKTNHCVWNYDSAKKDKDSGHITPKPIELLENIIKHTTDENDILLDCFAGTGSLGKSCLNLNRKCVLIEKDDSYNNYINKKLF